ncbi:hypothetical protein D3C80_1564120 [compost metagenome]
MTNAAADLAISVPLLPIATPICAAFNAGPSFTPSPSMATTSPLFFSAFTTASFASGNIRVNNVVRSASIMISSSVFPTISVPFNAGVSLTIPACNAIAFVVSALSPVITFTLIPAA